MARHKMARHEFSWLHAIPLVAVALAIGCEKPREKVLEIETPGTKIEVEKSTDGSELHIETERKDNDPNITIERDADPDGSVEIESKP
jgi:hypothetical protein